MSENLKIDTSIYIWLIIIVFVTPVAITLISEFIFTKKITLKIGGFTLLMMAMITATFAYQLQGTKVIINDGRLVLKSLFYSDEVVLDNILSVESFEQELPPRYYLIKRINGIHLPSYFVGKFKTHDKSDAFVLATYPPYLVVTASDNKLYIISSSNQVEEALLGFKESQ
ncbi:hypothetical protein CW613_001420 [Vibrio mimicus]|uniref:PH domain-containing protein n=1 Tax=Vibrio mimicus TaxID=674 RepID=UPI002F92F769